MILSLSKTLGAVFYPTVRPCVLIRMQRNTWPLIADVRVACAGRGHCCEPTGGIAGPVGCSRPTRSTEVVGWTFVVLLVALIAATGRIDALDAAVRGLRDLQRTRGESLLQLRQVLPVDGLCAWADDGRTNASAASATAAMTA